MHGQQNIKYKITQDLLPFQEGLLLKGSIFSINLSFMYLLSFIFGPLNHAVAADSWSFFEMPIPAPEWNNLFPFFPTS